MKYTRHEILTSDLCHEIDDLKNQVEYWKQKYKDERKQNDNFLNESLASSKREIANALSLCLSIKDNPDGSISIPKENRKQLSERYNRD